MPTVLSQEAGQYFIWGKKLILLVLYYLFDFFLVLLHCFFFFIEQWDERREQDLKLGQNQPH